MAVDITLDVALAVADLALLAAAGVGVLLSRGIRSPSAPDLPSAFMILDRSIAKYSRVPPGYTWGEALEQLKRTGVSADWDAVGTRLAEYEAFRYGGGEMPKGGQDEIVSLAMKLRRKAVG